MISRSVRLITFVFTCHCDQIIFTSVEVATRDMPGYARGEAPAKAAVERQHQTT